MWKCTLLSGGNVQSYQLIKNGGSFYIIVHFSFSPTANLHVDYVKAQQAVSSLCVHLQSTYLPLYHYYF